MKIYWINKFTIIDYPWKSSCIVFTPWCNFRCWYCHNPEFVSPELLKKNLKDLVLEKALFNFLEKRKWLLDGVSICWWEPTLQKDLVEFCERVKSMWFLVKLDTNWTKPEVLKQLLDKNLLDYIAMDIKHSIGKLKSVTWIDFDVKMLEKSMKLILDSGIDYEFRTTIVKGLHDLEDIKKISKSISWAKNYYIQNFRSWNTLVENFEWKSFTRRELESFKDVSKEYVESVEVRN